jgi:REP element-mobilizing transposase RayT
MSREAWVVAGGVPRHITQRGNDRQNVFLLDEDRRFYIETLRATYSGLPFGNDEFRRRDGAPTQLKTPSKAAGTDAES